MQRNECKPGTEVIIRGTIKEYDGTKVLPILVEIHDNKFPDNHRFFEPSSLELALPKYDPERQFREGDLVRITGCRRGHLFAADCDGRALSEGNEIGCEVLLEEEEDEDGNVALPEGVLAEGYRFLHVSCIELVKPVEEIEVEQPYKVKEMDCFFRVTRDYSYIYTIWWKSVACPTSPYNKEEARKEAQKLCNELNRKHRESLNA